MRYVLEVRQALFFRLFRFSEGQPFGAEGGAKLSDCLWSKAVQFQKIGLRILGYLFEPEQASLCKRLEGRLAHFRWQIAFRVFAVFFVHRGFSQTRHARYKL
jgi:hypothetical protein